MIQPSRTMLKKIFYGLILLITVLGVTYLAGPRAPQPDLSAELPLIQMDLQQLEASIADQEALVQGLKPDNEARIVWADSFLYQKSPFSVVYLHGFSASQEEGDPIHEEFARRYGCNLYLARLQEHGIAEEEALLKLSPEGLIETAKEAVAVGEQIGEQVILMSTSTGGTLSLYIGSENPQIAAHILYSPNIDLFDGTSAILTGPWGLTLARQVTGSNYRSFEATPEGEKYWTTKYRLEALVTLKALINATMTEEVFSQITSPVFLGYYYKSEEEQDNVVSIPRMMEMYDQLGTPDDLKRKVAFPDVNNHVIASHIGSEDLVSVREETFKYAEEVLGLVPVK